MSDTTHRGPVRRMFRHMRVNPLIWAAAAAVLGLICGYIRYSQGVMSHWGDAMAFFFLFTGIMIIFYGEQHRGPELPTSQPLEGSNV
jgi:hypothetical protein